MAIQSVIIDPTATPNQTGDEIIAKINAGSAAITREDSLDQDSLNIVRTGPGTGQHKVKNIQRQSDGRIEIEYDDVAEV